jgi:hypothetical protein
MPAYTIKPKKNYNISEIYKLLSAILTLFFFIVALFF